MAVSAFAIRQTLFTQGLIDDCTKQLGTFPETEGQESSTQMGGLKIGGKMEKAQKTISLFCWRISAPNYLREAESDLRSVKTVDGSAEQ